MACLFLLIGACGFGSRREQADYLIDTARRLHEAGTARLSVTTTFEPKEVIDRTIQTYPFLAPLHGFIDLGSRRAALSTQGSPALTFDGDRLFAYDLDEAQPDRPWIFVDLGDVEADDVDTPIVGTNLVSPIVWTELLAGALSGSVERGKTMAENGVQITHYTANVDREKTFTEFLDERLDEDTRTDLEEIFEINGLTSIVTPAEIWLDPQGLPRKIIYRAEQRVDRHNVFALTVTYTLSDFGKPVDVEIPTDDQSIEVDTVQQLLAESGIEGLAQARPGAPPTP